MRDKSLTAPRPALPSVVASPLRGLASVIWPPHCGVCGVPTITSKQAMCQSCAADIHLYGSDVCLRCGRGRGFGVGLAPQCAECEKESESWPFDLIVAAGPYRGVLRDGIRSLKFRAQLRLARPLGAWLAMALWSRGASVDAVVAMPLSGARRRERGFNQAELIAREVAKLLEVPLLPAVLRRKDAPPQFSLSEAERLENLKGRFSPGKRARAVTGRRVLLVDDVLTTGATARAAAKVLKQAKAAAVIVAVVARTQRDAGTPPSPSGND